MFTDLVGSTELLVVLGEDRFDSVRDEHDLLVGGSINAHHGEVVKHTGDGFMAVFPGAAEAIAAAAEIQRKISSRNETSDVGFDVRIGISAGDVAKTGWRLPRRCRRGGGTTVRRRCGRADSRLGDRPCTGWFSWWA
jgi:class 3 adenylate cyclase